MTEFEATVRTEDGAEVLLTGIEAESEDEAETTARWEAFDSHLDSSATIDTIDVEEV